MNYIMKSHTTNRFKNTLKYCVYDTEGNEITSIESNPLHASNFSAELGLIWISPLSLYGIWQKNNKFSNRRIL